MADKRGVRSGVLGSFQERVADLWGRVRHMRAVEAPRTKPAPAPLSKPSAQDIFELTVLAATPQSDREFKRYMDRFEASPTAGWLREHYADGPEAFDRDLTTEAKKAQSESLKGSLRHYQPAANTISDFVSTVIPDSLHDALHHRIGHTFVEAVVRGQGHDSRSKEAGVVFDQFHIDAPESWVAKYASELHHITETSPEDLLIDLASGLNDADRARFDEHRDSAVREAVTWVWDTRPVNTQDASIFHRFEERAIEGLEARTGIDLTPQLEERQEVARGRERRAEEVWPRMNEVVERLDGTVSGRAFSDFAYERRRVTDPHYGSTLEIAFAAKADVRDVDVPQGSNRADLFDERFKARLVDALVPFLDQVPAAERDATREQVEKDLASALRPSDLPTRQAVEAAVEKALAQRAEPAVQTEITAVVQPEVQRVVSAEPKVAQVVEPVAQAVQAPAPVAAVAPIAPAAVVAPAVQAPADVAQVQAAEPARKGPFGAFQPRGASSSSPAQADVKDAAQGVAPAAATTAAATPATAQDAVEVKHTGPWDDFPGQWNQKLYDFYRARYADPANNVAMSPREDAPDGFVKDAKGERKGLFDAAAFSKSLPEGTSRTEAFTLLDNAYREHQVAVAHSRAFAGQTDPDGIRLKLVTAAETASFHAERSALLRSRPDAVETNQQNARAAFGALFAYDVKHGHPLTDPDRDLKANPPTVQEQFNWLHRKDTYNGHEVERRLVGSLALGSIASEAHLFQDLMTGQGELIVGGRRSAIGFKPLQVIPLERSEFVAPQAMRTAIATEHAEQVAAKNKRTEELKAAQKSVIVELDKIKQAPGQKAQERTTDQEQKAPAVQAKPLAQESAAARQASVQAGQVFVELVEPTKAPAVQVKPFVPEADYQKTDRVVVARGKLVGSGVDTAKVDGIAPMPYASIEDRAGQVRKIFGYDIPRALEGGSILPGMTLELRGTTSYDTKFNHEQGQDVTTSYVHFTARPHDFAQHEAQQRAQHGATATPTLVPVQDQAQGKAPDVQEILPFAVQPDFARTKADYYARGTLVEHGVRPYQDRAGAKPSPFATVQDRAGEEHTVWGKDLPRAIEAGGLKVGDTVELRASRHEPKTVQLASGEQRVIPQITWSGAPHDFAQHEAEQRTAHDAQHSKVQDVVLATVEERMASWLDVNVNDPQQYLPLQRAAQSEARSPTLADAAAGQTRVVAHEEIQGEAQRQAGLAAAKNAPLSHLDADVLNESIKSIRVKGFTSDSVAYSLTMGDQTIDGLAKWDREADGLDGGNSAAIVQMTAGARLDRAMGGPLGPDDRELVDDVLHDHLQAQTQAFVRQHGHKVAPLEVLAPEPSRLLARLDARGIGVAQDEAQDQAQGERGQGDRGQGTAQGGASASDAATVQKPVQAAPTAKATEAPSIPVDDRVKRDLLDHLPGVYRARLEGDPAVDRLDLPFITAKTAGSIQEVTDEMRQAPAVAPIVHLRSKPTLMSDPAVRASLAEGSVRTRGEVSIPTEVNPALPLGPQVKAHNDACKDNSVEAKRLWESLGVTGPKAEAAQRARLGLPDVAQAQGQGHQVAQEESLGLGLNLSRRR